jgi:hypothetical protein
MDLGAPVLDVEQSVTSDATTKPDATISSDSSSSTTTSSSSSTTTAQTATESIVSGGVVTADGYDPIVITKCENCASSSSASRGIYNPEIGIVGDRGEIQNVNSKQVIVQQEKEL